MVSIGLQLGASVGKDEGNHNRCLTPSEGPVSKDLDFVDRSTRFHLKSKSHDMFDTLGVSTEGNHIAEDLIEVHCPTSDDVVPFTPWQFWMSYCHDD